MSANTETKIFTITNVEDITIDNVLSAFKNNGLAPDRLYTKRDDNDFNKIIGGCIVTALYLNEYPNHEQYNSSVAIEWLSAKIGHDECLALESGFCGWVCNVHPQLYRIGREVRRILEEEQGK